MRNTARAGWVRLLPADKADRTNVSTFDTTKRLAIECRLPGIVRSVEVRPDGTHVVMGHRMISNAHRTLIVSILGLTPNFTV